MEPAYPSSPGSLPKRRTPWNTLSARVLGVISRKGGVGKTTSAVNLGAAFALSGHTVLVVGVDPQCGVAPTLGARPADLVGGLLDLWDHDTHLTDLAQTSPLKDLFFVSSRVRDLDEEIRYLEHVKASPDAFVQQIDRARNLYDTIIVDCPPHLGAPTQAAIAASDGLLIPVQAEELCRESLGALLGALDSIKESSGGQALDGPELEGIFLTMYAERTRIGRHVSARVAEEFGPILFDTTVPRSTRLSEMALRGKPSVIYDRRSPGSRAYFNLADEIMERYRLRSGDLATESQLSAQAAAGGADAAIPSRAATDAPATRRSEAGGLDRLLGDLQRTGDLELPNVPSQHDVGQGDMISLDDLLREEESEAGEPWEGGWRRAGERPN
jgi:chromosome partitioning protein